MIFLKVDKNILKFCVKENRAFIFILLLNSSFDILVYPSRSFFEWFKYCLSFAQKYHLLLLLLSNIVMSSPSKMELTSTSLVTT